MDRKLPFWKQLLLDEYSPRCSALLVAVGMFIGLLPKENALAVLLLLLLVFIPGRLVYGITALVAFTFFSIPLDAFADRIGAVLHTNTAFTAFGSFLYTFPLGAWTRIDNTLVLGHFVLGSLLFVPVYSASLWMLKPATALQSVPESQKQPISEKSEQRPLARRGKSVPKIPPPAVLQEPLVEPDDEIEVLYSPDTSRTLESSGTFSTPKTGRFR